jgi:hypothetical protein
MRVLTHTIVHGAMSGARMHTACAKPDACVRACARARVSASHRDAGEAGAPSTAASSSRDEFSMSIVKSIGAPANETGIAPPRLERPRAESEADPQRRWGESFVVPPKKKIGP